MPLVEKRADGLVPSAQCLRVYECAGRERTLANLEPTGGGTKICSAQSLKASPAPLSRPAKATPNVSQEVVTFLFTITKFMLRSFSESRFSTLGALIGHDDVAPSTRLAMRIWKSVILARRQS